MLGHHVMLLNPDCLCVETTLGTTREAERSLQGLCQGGFWDDREEEFS